MICPALETYTSHLGVQESVSSSLRTQVPASVNNERQQELAQLFRLLSLRWELFCHLQEGGHWLSSYRYLHPKQECLGSSLSSIPTSRFLLLSTLEGSSWSELGSWLPTLGWSNSCLCRHLGRKIMDETSPLFQINKQTNNIEEVYTPQTRS